MVEKRRKKFLGGIALLSALGFFVLAAGVAQANTVKISGSMEGAIKISNGDLVSAGYSFSIGGAHPAMTVRMANASVVFSGKCSNGGTDTLTVPLSPGPYSVAANDNSWLPTGDEASPASFQGVVTANVCGGVGQLDASGGATFSGDLQSDVLTNQVSVRFHYRDPNAKGKGNFDCTAGTFAASVCGASWSGTATLFPDQLQASPQIVTNASPSATVGDTITDHATLSGGNSPTGKITWALYSDSGCTNQVYTVSAAVSGNGTYVTNPGYTTTGPGTYYWVATYSGDANNQSVSTSCRDANEQTTVNQQTPQIVTSATPSATVGDTIIDHATLSGGNSPTGQITWVLYSDSGCTNQVYTVSAKVSGNGTYVTNPGFVTKQAGTYYWVATYSGDSNNQSVSTSCQDANEQTTVNKQGLSIVTSATSGTVGDTIIDHATLSGGNNPTGKITWTLYSDSACSQLVYTVSADVTNGNGTYVTDPGYTPSGPGTFYWIATYSGDTNNASVSTSCGDPGEISTIKKASPQIVTSATPSATVGDTIIDHATLSGGVNPTGKITWTLYSDAACTSVVYTVSAAVSGNGTYVTNPGYTTTGPGTYYWVATYSGDSNNRSVSTSCGDANEQTPVQSPPKPGIEVVKLVSVRCADLASGASQPQDIVPCTGTWSSFTRGVPILEVPRTGSYAIPVQYQIQVTNTGDTPLTLSLSDPLCDPGSIGGPYRVSGTLTGMTLSAGGRAYYTCSHTLTERDPELSAPGQPFTNVATVTGQPPSGPPVHGSSQVTVKRQPPPQNQRFCRNAKNGKKVPWPRGKPKPKACKKPPPKPKRPKHPSGFTG